MTDIMLDIETLGLKPGSIVISVGACVFDRATGEIGEEFYTAISAESCEEYGLFAEAGTVSWWMMQDDAARAVFHENWKPLMGAACEFQAWANQVNDESATFWAQGDMDFQVWGAAMDAVCIVRPWRFNHQRDTRTAYDICSFDAKAVERDGTYHNALDDARHQVKCLHAAMKSKGLAQ